MGCIDFEYDNQKLSDYGCRVCHIDNRPNGAVKTSGEFSLDTLSSGTNKFDLLNAHYTAPYYFEIEICKINGGYFEDKEITKFQRWLQRKTYLKFKPIYEEKKAVDIYFKGTFKSVDPIVFGGNVIGIKLYFSTNSSNGCYEKVAYTYELTEDSKSFSIYSLSDDIGYIYVDMTIECLGEGKLTIDNSLVTDRRTIIDNCVAGEVITISGKYQQIISNMRENLCEDFNFSYPVLSTVYEEVNSMNNYTFSIPCIVTLSYSPICRLGVL